MSADLTFEEKYKAIVNKDSNYEGIFFTAVKTTGIFCRPVCTARKPKPENVVFYDSPEEAILNGFRPCKVCKPLSHANETPDYIQNIKTVLYRIKVRDLIGVNCRYGYFLDPKTKDFCRHNHF